LRLAAPDGEQMGGIVGFVSKSELERVRLIREAREIYESIFPPTDAVGEPPHDRASKSVAAGLESTRSLERKRPNDGALIALRSP
jgi:hypothetical protein